MRLKLSKVSENGRPTNFSVFYKNYVDGAINEADIHESNAKKPSTRESKTSSSKKTGSRNDNKLADLLKNSIQKPVSQKKLNESEVENSKKSLSKKIRSALESENNQSSQKDLEKIQTDITTSYDPKTIEEFFKFCKVVLPDDSRYKESILFVSLFYYFLETKNLLN